jgi:hypothetical protein
MSGFQVRRKTPNELRKLMKSVIKKNHEVTIFQEYPAPTALDTLLFPCHTCGAWMQATADAICIHCFSNADFRKGYFGVAFPTNGVYVLLVCADLAGGECAAGRYHNTLLWDFFRTWTDCVPFDPRASFRFFESRELVGLPKNDILCLRHPVMEEFFREECGGIEKPSQPVSSAKVVEASRRPIELKTLNDSPTHSRVDRGIESGPRPIELKTSSHEPLTLEKLGSVSPARRDVAALIECRPKPGDGGQGPTCSAFHAADCEEHVASSIGSSSKMEFRPAPSGGSASTTESESSGGISSLDSFLPHVGRYSFDPPAYKEQDKVQCVALSFDELPGEKIALQCTVDGVLLPATSDLQAATEAVPLVDITVGYSPAEAENPDSQVSATTPPPPATTPLTSPAPPPVAKHSSPAQACTATLPDCKAILKSINSLTGNSGKTLKQVLPQVRLLHSGDYRRGRVAKEDYRVCEKSDGVRAVAIFTGEHAAIMGGGVLHAVTPHGGPTLLVDGELLGNGILQVHDVAAINGISIMHEPHSVRSTYIKSACDQLCNIGLPAREKVFRDIETGMAEALASLTSHPNHAVDGLILTQKSQPFSLTQVYKWKPVDCDTIDFMVVRGAAHLFGHTTYTLLVGATQQQISARKLCVPDRLPSPDLTAEVFSKNNYYPVLFTPAWNGGAYLYHHPNCLPQIEDGACIELSLDPLANVRDPRAGSIWLYHGTRVDRTVDVQSHQYYGNNFNVAEAIGAAVVWDHLTVSEIADPRPVLWDRPHDMRSEASNYARRVRAKLLSTLDGPALLDYGCGQGSDLTLYHENVVSVTGVDIEPRSLAEYLHRVQALRNPRGRQYSLFQIVTPSVHEFCDGLHHRGFSPNFDSILLNNSVQYLCYSAWAVFDLVSAIRGATNPRSRILLVFMNGARVHDLLANGAMKIGEEYQIDPKYPVADGLKDFGQEIAVRLPGAGSSTREWLVNPLVLAQCFRDAGFSTELRDLTDAEPTGDLPPHARTWFSLFSVLECTAHSRTSGAEQPQRSDGPPTVNPVIDVSPAGPASQVPLMRNKQSSETKVKSKTPQKSVDVKTPQKTKKVMPTPLDGVGAEPQKPRFKDRSAGGAINAARSHQSGPHDGDDSRVDLPKPQQAVTCDTPQVLETSGDQKAGTKEQDSAVAKQAQAVLKAKIASVAKGVPPDVASKKSVVKPLDGEKPTSSKAKNTPKSRPTASAPVGAKARVTIDDAKAPITEATAQALLVVLARAAAPTLPPDLGYDANATGQPKQGSAPVAPDGVMRICKDCGAEFPFTSSEQTFYKKKSFDPPQRCELCRLSNKTTKKSLAPREQPDRNRKLSGGPKGAETNAFKVLGFGVNIVVTDRDVEQKYHQLMAQRAVDDDGSRFTAAYESLRSEALRRKYAEAYTHSLEEKAKHQTKSNAGKKKSGRASDSKSHSHPG